MIIVQQTKNFFMTSYVVWLVAQVGKFSALKIEGKLGEELEQKRVWEYYTQLPISQAKLHFKKINDAFIYVVIIKLIGDVGFRLTVEAMQMIKMWGCWFLQKQWSTYLRVSGFTGNPFLLPRYCSNRIIIFEYAR